MSTSAGSVTSPEAVTICGRVFVPSGGDRDSVCGGDHAAASAEREDGAASLLAASGP